MTEPSKTPRTRTEAIMVRVRALCPNFDDIEGEIAALEADLMQQCVSLSEGSSKWIPVGERLPDEAWAIDTGGVTFLACNDRGFVFCTSSHPSWWNHKDKRGPEFNGPSVTHWMPLPEAPK